MSFKGDAVRVIDWIQKPLEQVHLEPALRAGLQRSSRLKILHVKDDLDIAQITQVLREDWAEYSHVSGVSEARQRLATQVFDLVVLDFRFADGSGVELLGDLKGQCPVIIFSAWNPGRETTAQVTAALTKSAISNEQLRATVRNIIKGWLSL